MSHLNLGELFDETPQGWNSLWLATRGDELREVLRNVGGCIAFGDDGADGIHGLASIVVSTTEGQGKDWGIDEDTQETCF